MQYQSSFAPRLARKCENKHWFTCGADGWAGGRAVYCHVITKFSGMGRFTYPWCSAGALSAIKRFHEENSIMSGLFSQNNLLLCGMQGNNGLSAKTLKNFQSHLYSYSVLTFDRRQICSASWRCLNNIIKDV